MERCEFYDEMMKAGVLIDKHQNEDLEKVRISAYGAIGAVYGVLAHAITNIANQSESSLYSCWCMVNAIRDEIMENPDDMAIIARFEDEADLKAQEDYEDLERTTWETQDLRTFAEMSEDSEGGLISED